jgi:hypothetical protein
MDVEQYLDTKIYNPKSGELLNAKRYVIEFGNTGLRNCLRINNYS